MPPTETFLVFTRRFAELGVRYMVSGSIAAVYYGEPRLTNDVHMVVRLKREHVTRLKGAFPANEFYCPPEDVVLIEIGRRQRGHFNLIHHETGFKADIYPVRADPLHVWGLTNARQVQIEGEAVTLAPPEYVIARKLQFFREGGAEKHLRDIKGMLASFGEDWDRTTIEEMVREYKLAEQWRQANDCDE